MKKYIFVLCVGLLFLAANAVNTNAQSVSGSIGNGTVTRGKATRGTIVLTIPGNLHVNSNRPGNEYQIPTTVSLSGTGAKVGGVTYPRGKNRKFGFSENAINVYEGRVSFPFTVTVPANFKGNSIKVRATVKYQACTDEVCYPPKSKEVTLTAKVN
ncbi:MAG TPA: protein-disulfide reductase DsbD N-terminal domain-containing protein [Pyrinomonadaceae bacterium]|nr:protein-disulfide reductase DsbD N-terminal domain-containing protein [Pyrinomonadaceae bacterium]